MSRGYATAYRCRHNRARLYHVHHRALYRAIGEPESRHRRALSAARMVEGLTLLDGVLATPDLVWLATEEEKQIHLSCLAGVESEKLPHVTVGDGVSKAVRIFPDKVPIGVDLSGRFFFLYLVTDHRLDAFRGFLQRHADLFRTLSGWTLRVIIPPHLESLSQRCAEVIKHEFASPRPRHLKVLLWYFKQRRAHEVEGVPIDNEEDYYQTRAAFAAPWFQVLYRRWIAEGDTALEVYASEPIADAIQRGSGSVEYQVLPHHYRHLSPLVNTTQRRVEGAEEGEDASARPRPPIGYSTARTESDTEGASFERVR